MKKGSKWLALLLCLAMVGMLLMGCSGSSGGTEEAATEEAATEEAAETAEAEPAGDDGGAEETASGGYKILMIPKLMGIPYFEMLGEGAQEAADAAGCELIFTGGTTIDASEQVKIIEDYIGQGVDCILIDANDAAALTPCLQKAKDAGILVMDWDAPADPEDVEYTCLSVPDPDMGAFYMDELVKTMGDEGEVAVVIGSLTSVSLNAWADYAFVRAEEAYPNVHLVTDYVPCDESSDVAYQKTLELIKAYPDLKGIIAISSTATPGVAQAIYDSGLQDQITVAGGTMPSEVESLIRDGSLDACIGWNPARFGYFCVSAAVAVLNGETIENGMTIGDIDDVLVDGKLITMPVSQTVNTNAETIDLDGYYY